MNDNEYLLAYITANRKAKHNSYLSFIECDFTHDGTGIEKI